MDRETNLNFGGVDMDFPIDRIAFGKFVRNSNIFELTRTAMVQCLKNWYNDDRDRFLDDMRADFHTVMGKYHFYDKMVSFNKNFEFDLPLDTITCIITINDDEDDYCISYRAIFDYDLHFIDDVISR